MPEMKVFPECVALLADVVGSRRGQRDRLHAAILAAITATNEAVEPSDPLRVTVGDELQGVYPTLGRALAATFHLRNHLLGTADLRFGLGGGEVRVVDPERGIQDGSAWWLAREAIGWVEELAGDSGHGSARTAIRDDRTVSSPLADPTVRLVDARLAQLRDGARRSLVGLLAGRENAEVAAAEGITPSANSQRVNANGLRPLADAMLALTALP